MSETKMPKMQTPKMFEAVLCDVCKKQFIPAPAHMYKLYVNRRVQIYCSYTCYRKAQKELENKKGKNKDET